MTKLLNNGKKQQLGAVLLTLKKNLFIICFGGEIMRNTTLCYIENDGQYLMLHRVKKINDVNKDKWIGIGGGFEADESPEDCIRREAIEETGLTLGDLKLRSVITFIIEGGVCE